MLKDNLAMLRNIHGYSQEGIAEKIGISRQAYAKWESGATVPDIEKCALLADVYETTIDSLIRTEPLEGVGMIPPAPKGKNIWGTVTVNDRGQIVIPKGARDAFNLFTGANKSSYIDNFLDRADNATNVMTGLARALRGDMEYRWFLC